MSKTTNLIDRGDHGSTSQSENRAVMLRSKLDSAHWCVLAASLVLTLGAWYFARCQVRDRIEAQFEFESTRVIALIQEQMVKYEDVLWSAVASIHSRNGEVEYRDWKTYAENLRIEQKYPGITGIGFINRLAPDEVDAYLARQRVERPTFHIHPHHNEPEYWPITVIEPFETNAQAVGLDMAHEVNRRTAAQRARDTGLAQITGPIVLVQGKTPGFLFYAPWYEAGTLPNEEARRQRIVGLVYAPFVFRELIAGTLDQAQRHVEIRVADQMQVLYDEHNPDSPDHDPNPLFSRRFDLDIYGRTWQFDIRSDLAFREANRNSQPSLILFGGLCLDGLIFCLFLMLSRANRRAVRYAKELRQRTSELQSSNEDLEKFAYIASHDLKTPLRGIDDLRGYLEHDLKNYLCRPDSNPDVRRNLDRLQVQVHRMDSLIRGILQYSSAGSSVGEVVRVDTGALVAAIATDLHLQGPQLDIQDLPVLEANPVPLHQIFSNLMCNAVKYHHRPDELRIEVTCHSKGQCHTFGIRDNGPGIAPRYHERVFEVFQTLQPKDKIEGTGIGLAIVKKIVESQGGELMIDSAEGAGLFIGFTWFASTSPIRGQPIAVS